MDNIAEKIIVIRRNKGLSQEAFAKSLGYSRSYLANIESGKSLPSRRFLEAMQRYCGIPIDWLFTESLINDILDANKDTPNPSLIFVYAFTQEGIDESEIKLKAMLSGRRSLFVDASSLKTYRQLYMTIIGEKDSEQKLYYKMERLLAAEDIVLVIKNMSTSKISNAGAIIRELFKLIDDYHIYTKEAVIKRWPEQKILHEFAQSSLIVLDYPSFMENNMQFGYYAVPIYLLTPDVVGNK